MCKVEDMYLLFDIGGTNTKIGLSIDGKSIVDSQITSTKEDPQEFISKLKETADLLSKTNSLKAAAFGIRGVLDENREILRQDRVLKNWAGKPLKQMFQEVLNVPVFLENDAAFSALGEAVYGPGAGFPIVGYIGIGTGIGGARVVNGKIDAKAVGFEPGNQVITLDGEKWEDLVSGASFEKKYGKKPEDIHQQPIWDEAAKNLAIGLNNISVLWSPNIIILGGGLMQKISLEAIQQHLNGHLKVFPTTPKLALARYGQLSGLYGALEYIRQNI